MPGLHRRPIFLGGQATEIAISFNALHAKAHRETDAAAIVCCSNDSFAKDRKNRSPIGIPVLFSRINCANKWKSQSLKALADKIQQHSFLNQLASLRRVRIRGKQAVRNLADRQKLTLSENAPPSGVAPARNQSITLSEPSGSLFPDSATP